MSLFSDRRRALIGSNEYFPPDPGNYPNLEQTFTSSGTFTAPSTGWYEIQIFGAVKRGGYRSLSGTFITDPYEEGNPDISGYYSYVNYFANGAGSGSGGFSSSRVKLNEGDTVSVTVGYSDCYAVINSSVTDGYEDVRVNVGSDAGSGNAVGSGGVAIGGNYQNINGNPGTPGARMEVNATTSGYSIGDVLTTTVGQGGAAVVQGGNAGSKGAETILTVVRYYFDPGSSTSSQICFEDSWSAMGDQKKGLCKIYSGEYAGG